MEKADEALADEEEDSNKTERKGEATADSSDTQKQSLVITMESYIPENSEEWVNSYTGSSINIKKRRFKQVKQTHSNKANKVARNLPTLNMSGSKGLTVQLPNISRRANTNALQTVPYTEGRNIVSNIL